MIRILAAAWQHLTGRSLIGLLCLLLFTSTADATDYSFPGALPAGCSGSAGVYTCSGLNLAYGDTVSIQSRKPAAIRVTGTMDTNNARINPGGAAADLSLTVTGALKVGYGATINANISAATIDTTGGSVVIVGDLVSTTGAVTLGYQTQLTGSITSKTDVDTGQSTSISGNITALSGRVNLRYGSKVGGNIATTTRDILLDQSTAVGGNLGATTGAVELGYGANVAGNLVTTTGVIKLGQTSVVQACVQSSASAKIILDYQSSAGKVCCGSLGSCGSSCVANNSSLPMPATCTAILVARYDLEESTWSATAGELKDTAGYTGGPFNGVAQGAPLPTTATTSPARTGNPGTCGYASLAGPTNNGAGFLITGLPVSTTTGAKTTVAFWMYWNGTDSVMPMGWSVHDLWLVSGAFGFNSGNSDVYGIASTGLSGGWRHVVAVFTNGSVVNNKLYIDGVSRSLSQQLSSLNASTAVVNNAMRISGWGANTGYRFGGRLDQFQVFNGEPSAAEVATLYAESHACAGASATTLHHLEIRHASGSGLTCSPDTVTVAACQDAACLLPLTTGLTGTLAASGAGMSVNWPDGAGFAIPAGSSTTTLRLQQTTAGSSALTISSPTPAASNATTCNFGSPACTWTAVDAGFLFNVPNHVSEVAQTVSISAVKKADNSGACVPAFASTSKSVTFSCGYTNPASGTLPVRVGGAALNSGNSAAAACDAGGRAVALAFNTSGVASTTVAYADVGQVSLAARYAGTAGTSEASLVMTGSDSFIAAPHSLAFSGITAGPIKAGSPFSATVSARNAALATTPNFGRETSPESMTIGFTRLAPTGSGAAEGSFTGSLGVVSAGAASASNLAWTEVGRGDLVARLASGSYLGTGMTAFGASPATGALACAVENGVCALPLGVTATVYYGANGAYFARSGQTLATSCSSGLFGDPLPGTVKACYYVATAATTGSVGDFIPHHFNVASTAACGAFSYAGQPFASTVTAVNAAGSTTRNFDGSVLTSPNFAQAVTLSDGLPLNLGTMAGNSIATSGFSAGVASAAPSYAFTTKATAPQTLAVRAANGAAGSAAISSAGFTEGSMALKSGRLRLSNAFGSARAVLQIPVVAEHWSGNAWVLNSADNCSTLAAGSVALSNPRSAAGLLSTALSSVTGALALVNGSGLLTLAAPLPLGNSLSLDVSINLGSTTADQSCHASHPVSLGAAKPWLRAQNGSCAATADRDPAARASFGIFSPESKKTVHVRELF